MTTMPETLDEAMRMFPESDSVKVIFLENGVWGFSVWIRNALFEGYQDSWREAFADVWMQIHPKVEAE